ncbi:major facilitator superfamily domain-containing protein [Aspergillus novoparasiticus]|uniref:Major facilitator superfamily domain-containing protein n=1 Tax=Aspergillus novoparasiticus TaxID=986946 RepID=A0A5N6F091_9EURO|nr:major facilitator superfamily domain-containing protein [Aspergillus novoparasiticus]
MEKNTHSPLPKAKWSSSRGEACQKGYGWRLWAIFPGLCIRGLLNALDTTILSTELYVWAINGYFVSQTAVQPLYGQGLGGGGINVMTEMIVADLVPLRERQQVMGIIFTAFAVGTSIGPVVGGAIVDHTSMEMGSTVTAKLKRVDFAGNAILITSVISILLALTWAGTTHPWESWRTISLVSGTHNPFRLFANRTAALTYILSFLHGIILYWASFFLPVYFQSVLEATPEKSGFDLFTSVIPMVPGAIIGGVLITVTGKYKPLLVAGFVLMAIGMGLFTMLDDRTSTVRWVVYQVILALGAGISLIATLPAVLASLPESDVATATATWAFLRSFGSIWDLVGRIASPQLQGVLVGGGAYQLATKAFMESLDDTPVVKAQTVSVYAIHPSSSDSGSGSGNTRGLGPKSRDRSA